jgi:hypothetical protein
LALASKAVAIRATASERVAALGGFVQSGAEGRGSDPRATAHRFLEGGDARPRLLKLLHRIRDPGAEHPVVEETLHREAPRRLNQALGEVTALKGLEQTQRSEPSEDGRPPPGDGGLRTSS